MATESVQDVCCSCEVQNLGCRCRMNYVSNLGHSNQTNLVSMALYNLRNSVIKTCKTVTQIQIGAAVGDISTTSTYLTMSESGNCHVPRCVGDHNETKEGPESVIPERGHQHCEHATGSEDVGPFPLVQVIVDQKDIAAVLH